MINVGDAIPDATITVIDSDGQQNIAASDYFAGKKAVLFALPGAFTPTCSEAHLPGFVVHYDDIRAKGVDVVACLSVNDAFVMGAWSKDQGADGKVRMMADGSADWTRKLGLELDLTERGMGVRCQRFSMVVNDGKVEQFNLEGPGKFEVSDAQTMLGQLG